MSEENIKEGVTIGGVTGTLQGEHKGTLTFDIYNASSNDYSRINITDRTGQIYYAPSSGSKKGTCNFTGNMIAIFTVNGNHGSCTGCNFIETSNTALLYEITTDNPSIKIVR